MVPNNVGLHAAAKALLDAIDAGRPAEYEVAMLRKELSVSQESGWSFKTIAYQTITLPNGRNEIQFSIMDATAPQGWSTGGMGYFGER
jgi:hypothetical protein